MIGQVISHYKILEKLGEGGMGVVYKAQDTKLDRVVALKFLPHHVVATEAEQSRFLQEAKSAAVLNHPNVCVIYSIEESDDKQFIVMEYVDGQTLRGVIEEQRDTPMKFTDAVAYAVQIGEALQEAHSKGIVHRDIKSENIMLNSKRQIKVMDFGLAKLKGSLKLTRSSSTVGTLAYMAPEQLQGGEVDARSDIFSFGAVIFEMLTGKLPFRGEHEAAMMYSIVNEEPESILTYRPDASPDLDRILRRALEKDPNERYQHADDLTSELKRLLRQSSRVSTPGMVSSATASIPQAKPSPVFGKRSVIMGVVGVVIVAAALSVYLMMRPAQAPIDSLAVLPFVNVTQNPDTEYLSDGMTESIINSLTKIQGIRVIPRSTVFRFKGKDIDPEEVGSKLNVSAILTGRVVQRDDILNLQLDLIDVNNQSQIYGNQYQFKAAEILSMQEKVVADLVNQLGTNLTAEKEKAITRRQTDNVEAYKLYMQGRYHWQKRKADEIQKSIALFNQALALDASYALAYAGLADSYVLLEQYAGMPGKEVYPKAVAAATRALEIDPSLAEAHTTLAFANFASKEWKKAEEGFKYSLSLNPNYPTTYHWYSILLQTLGQRDEAFKLIKHAQTLDPLSLVIGINVGLAYHLNGEYERAIQEMHAALRIDSSFSVAYYRQSEPYVKLGKLQEAYVASLKGVETSDRSPEALSFLGYCAALLGKTNEAVSILHELEERAAHGTCPGYYIARVSAGLGDSEKIFKWLNVDFENHSGSVIWLTQEDVWDPYRSDPRFVELLTKLGLAQ